MEAIYNKILCFFLGHKFGLPRKLNYPMISCSGESCTVSTGDWYSQVCGCCGKYIEAPFGCFR